MSVNQESQSKSKRIFYLDALRCLAIIAVILVHVFMPARSLVLSQYSTFPSLNWWITDFFVANRCGVDIFLLLAGALSLGRPWKIKPFLEKRIPRIVFPFLFWGFILSIGFIVLSYMFPDTIPIVKAFDIKSLIAYIVHAYIADSVGFGPYWFFWMILGTYLIMPIFNKWLCNAKLTDVEYFLAIWLVTCVFDFTLNHPFIINLSYFTSPIGLVVCGCYLRHTPRKIFNNIYVPIILIIAGCACTIFGSYWFSTSHKFFWFNRYSIFLVMEVAGLFLLARYLDESDRSFGVFSNPKGIFKRAVTSIAKYSYGIYLIHNFLVSIVFNPIKILYPNAPFKLSVLCVFLTALLGSWAIMAILNRVPHVKNIIGAK